MSLYDNRKKKTLCQYYLQKTCKRNRSECFYAHGIKDLNNPYYKTKLCCNYNNNCRYGDVCCYAHSKKEYSFYNNIKEQSLNNVHILNTFSDDYHISFIRTYLMYYYYFYVLYCS